MRQFKLKNANGEEFNLMRKDAFFHAPDGLGFDRDISVLDVGLEFIPASDRIAQKSISGEIVFKEYEQYTEFMKFYKPPLTLCYKPTTKWFYIGCDIQTLGKTEIKNVLICPVSFVCTTTWYEEATVRKTTAAAGGKTYPYTYNYTYRDAATGSVTITNNGLESPCRIHIFGPAINPAWALVGGANGKVDYTIPEGNKLIVDSSPSNIEISEYTVQNVFVKNLYQYSDFSTARFITIPNGEQTISFSHDGTSALEAYVEVKLLAETV